MMASTTTFTNAKHREVHPRRQVTAKPFLTLKTKMVRSEIDSIKPINITYDFLLVPNKGTLSEISPYRIFTDHGSMTKDIYPAITPGSNFK
jgi:hypothetical protein